LNIRRNLNEEISCPAILIRKKIFRRVGAARMNLVGSDVIGDLGRRFRRRPTPLRPVLFLRDVPIDTIAKLHEPLLLTRHRETLEHVSD
jgi:hypothetical protein